MFNIKINYQEMLRLQPDKPRGYYYMGMAYQALGEQDAAIKAWQKSLHLQPSITILPLHISSKGNIRMLTLK
jgi:tetratricopeptide (TPR) repeat protein